jgi:hypothetical protein
MAHKRGAHEDRLPTLAAAKGVILARDLEELAIPRVYLQRLVELGLLVKTGRSLYVHADADLSEHHTLLEAS